MAWHYGTFACGHEGRVQIYGKNKDRDWKAEREFSGLCEECGEKKRAEDFAAANDRAKESGLTLLMGSEKQVVFADKCRQELLEKMDEICNLVVDDQKEEVKKIVEYIKANKNKASWWIETRLYSSAKKAILESRKEMVIAEKEKEVRDEAKELEKETLICPPETVTETVAYVRALGDAVEVNFPERNDIFRDIAKNRLKMKWTGNCWRRELIYRNGSSQDRAAEAAHTLLANGFIVSVLDDEIRQKIIDGNFDPENTRWIVALKEKQTIGIVWDKAVEDFYNVSRKLPGSQWSNPYVVVRPEHYADILDFATMYDFAISDGARKLMNEARESKEKALVLEVQDTKTDIYIADDKPNKLDIPDEVDIDEEFRDND